MRERSTLTRTRTAPVTPLVLLTSLVLASAGSGDALQYQPLEAYATSEECALILNGPGRTSVYDYTYNLLRGSFPPAVGNSQQTCITYEAVNRAYLEARKRINVAQPKTEKWRPEDLATVGELLLDISTNLAHTYGLTTEEIEKSLPLIDTSKTFISEVCPAFLSNVECRPGKYRRYDGLCTNLQNPTWGSTLSPFTRLLPPRFADGLTAPRISVTGHELPLARVVSRTMHPDEGFHDHAGTVMVIAWGQFMDHDYTLTGTPLDPLNRNDPEECCGRPPHLRNPYCNEILIPEDDYFYRLFNVKCIDFVRAFPAVRPGCRLGSRVPFNLLTGVLDGNTVYGITDEFSRKLRSGYGGLLRMNPVFSEYGLKDLLPLKLDIPDEGCTRPNRSMYCFEAGEIRVNEQLVLTCMHTLMAREHNRVAKGLAQVNPHWDDETLFQEARRIIIAEIQHVTYNEFLPILLGKDVMEKFGLLLEKEGYWDGYDPTINPGVIDAFAAAAFRFGHSLLPTAVERWSKAHKFIASKRLSDLIRRPYDLYRAGVLDEYFMGLMNQVAQAMDDSITQEVTNHLFKKVGAKFGMDLVSFNMQRGREFGIPSYMEFRKFCGLPGADTFEELFGSMPNETIRRYSSIFEHPSDVDLWSGGVSERPLPGSMLGPTFACVIATQFSYSRRGDRFWYELPNQPSSFTPEQLQEIRKTKLAKLICDNTDLIDTIQIYPMVLPDHEINPRVPCRSGVLPGIDFSKWAEFPASGPVNTAQYDETNTNKDISSANSDPVLWNNKDVFTEETMSSTIIESTPILAKDLRKSGISNLKNIFPAIRWHIIEGKFLFKDIVTDAEIPEVSTVVEKIREKNRKQSLNKKRKDQKRKKGKKLINRRNRQKLNPQFIDKYTKAIIKKKTVSDFGKKNLGKSKKFLKSSKMLSEMPGWDSSKKFVDEIVERAQLLAFLENLYRQSFPEEIVKQIIEKYTVKNMIRESLDPADDTTRNKIGTFEAGDKMDNVMVIDSPKYLMNEEQKHPRSKRWAENTANDPEETLEVKNRSIKDKENSEQLFPKPRTERSAKQTPTEPANSTQTPELGLKSGVERLYRHPRLSYEDQRDTVPEIPSTNPPIPPRIHLQITTARPNLLYQRIWNIINDTRISWPEEDLKSVQNGTSLPKEVESKRLDKPYVPVIADRKDTKASTASEVADLTAPSKKLPFARLTKAEENASAYPIAPGYKQEVKSFNPNNERKKYKELDRPYPLTLGDNDEVKSTIQDPGQSDSLSWRPIKVLDRKETYTNLQDHQQGSTGLNVPTYPPDIPPYNPDKIPYVEVPDYSDRREESLDKDEVETKLKSEPDVIDPTDDGPDDTRLEKSTSANEDREENSAKFPISGKTPRQDVSKAKESQSSEKIQRRLDDEEDTEEPEESGKVQKEKPAEDFQVHFDINEYRKPFDLDEFLKNDPIFRSFRGRDGKEENEEEVKADKSSQRGREIPVHEEVKKTDNQEDGESSEINEKHDYQSSANENYDSASNVNSTDDSKEILQRVTEDEFRYGDKNFFEPIFGKQARTEPEENGEEEFVSHYFSDHAKRKFREDLNEEKKKKKREETPKQENVYRKLTTITDKSPDDDKKTDENAPHKYKKLWVLEYGFPHKDEEKSKQDEKDETFA